MALINCPECNKQISDKADVCVGCGAPVEVNHKSIIGIPIKFGNLEVAQYDYNSPIFITWGDAKIACAKLGNGWRLPSKDELDILYDNKDKIGGFARDYYWSSTEFDDYDAWLQDFANGSQGHNLKFYTYYVRAVRSL
jgi:hypothetical protein